MRRIVFCFLIIVCCTNLCAQNANRNSLVGRINDIKKQSDTYFWDQYTHPDADTAKIGSVKRIIIHIESSLNDQEKFSIEEVLPYTEFISINRGNLKQYFAYIKKSVAFAIKSGGMPPSVSETPASVEAKTNESIIMPSTPLKRRAVSILRRLPLSLRSAITAANTDLSPAGSSPMRSISNKSGTIWIPTM